jgi:hypothetical protein
LPSSLQVTIAVVVVCIAVSVILFSVVILH